MAKFKVGDKVYVAGGPTRVFTIKDTREYGGETSYMVESKGYPTHWQLEKYIRAANSRAHNSRLNIRVGSQIYDPKNGEIYRVQKINGDTIIAKSNLNGEVKSFKNDDEVVGIFSNSRVCNAKFKVGGKVLITKGFQKGKVGKVLDGPIYDDLGEFYRVFVCGLSEDYDASFLKAANSRACNSTNPVVRKAMNAVARN